MGEGIIIILNPGSLFSIQRMTQEIEFFRNKTKNNFLVFFVKKSDHFFVQIKQNFLPFFVSRKQFRIERLNASFNYDSMEQK